MIFTQNHASYIIYPC